MHPFPHRYVSTAAAGLDGDVRVESEGLPPLATDAPVAFGGPGDRWSPESLLVAAVADCFALTFRAVARAAGLSWTALSCEAEGVLDRVDRTTRFTEVRVRASLRVPAGTDEARARSLLERAEHLCLITNSLNAAVHFDATVEVEHLSAAAT